MTSLDKAMNEIEFLKKKEKLLQSELKRREKLLLKYKLRCLNHKDSLFFDLGSSKAYVFKLFNRLYGVGNLGFDDNLKFLLHKEWLPYKLSLVKKLYYVVTKKAKLIKKGVK